MTDTELEQSWKMLNLQTDTLLKLTQTQAQTQGLTLEPWKLVVTAMGAGAAFLGVAVAIAALVIR